MPSPDRNTITLDVKKTNTIDEVKEMIQEKGGIDIEDQRIIFKGINLFT